MIYLDCAATTPLDPGVRDEVMLYLDEDYGNAGSRTHAFGTRARSAVERARDRLADAIGASRGDVIFTSGATESNNLAILGLTPHGESIGRRHIVSTAIEHHAVLEPLAELERRGFHVDYVMPESSGAVDPERVKNRLRPETLLVSVMHVNNETGVIQPISDIAALLENSDVFFHVDAAQSFGKDALNPFHPRIDMISISGHKIHAPKGIGALIARRRHNARPPLTPLMHGGAQERGLRPGTLPVALIAGLGKAAELASSEGPARTQRCREFRDGLLQGLSPLQPVTNGDPSKTVSSIVNLSIPGIDAETAIECWHDLVAISHGAACTSHTYTCSHVLSAMGLPVWQQDGALRFSWCHSTPLPDFQAMIEAIERNRRPTRSVSS